MNQNIKLDLRAFTLGYFALKYEYFKSIHFSTAGLKREGVAYFESEPAMRRFPGNV